MINFKLRVEIGAPFHLSSHLTLDALLSAAVFNATGLTGEDTIPEIPLARENEVFKGSCLFVPRGFRHVSFGRVMSLRTERDLSVDLFGPNMRSGKYGYVDQQRGAYKANMMSYPGIECPEVYFWGVGDPERASYLLREFVFGIGSRSNAGAGEILSVAWEETEEDLSWRTASGDPARPLPASLWSGIGGSPRPVAPLPIALPTWSAPKVEAVYPASLVV